MPGSHLVADPGSTLFDVLLVSLLVRGDYSVGLCSWDAAVLEVAAACPWAGHILLEPYMVVASACHMVVVHIRQDLAWLEIAGIDPSA